MEKWEYKVIWFSPSKSLQEIENTINGLGNDGWEMTSASDSGGNKLVYLKRRKES